MSGLSRRCVPYTPLDRELSRCTVALLSATGIYHRDQAAFPTSDEACDVSWRVIPGDTPNSDLRIAHHHYDHSEADLDPNIVFPLETLRQLAAEGIIEAVADKHYSYGYCTRLRELYEQTGPELVRAIERSSTDLVILTAGCPQVCHRSVVMIGRELELRGIPTVAITVSLEATASARPPRALHPQGFELGRVVGRAHDRATHQRVVMDALMLCARDLGGGWRPGKVESMAF